LTELVLADPTKAGVQLAHDGLHLNSMTVNRANNKEFFAKVVRWVEKEIKSMPLIETVASKVKSACDA
jgi:hypothetical protein